MNDVMQKLLDNATINCMGVNQVNHGQLIMSIVEECINCCGSDFGADAIREHFGIDKS